MHRLDRPREIQQVQEQPIVDHHRRHDLERQRQAMTVRPRRREAIQKPVHIITTSDTEFRMLSPT